MQLLFCFQSISRAISRYKKLRKEILDPKVEDICILGWAVMDSSSWSLKDADYPDNMQIQYSARTDAKNEYFKEA